MEIIKLHKNENGCGCGCGSQPLKLTLPVAPRPFARIRFAVSEAEARAIPSSGALKWLEENIRQGAKVAGVELAGPGDPLADMESTLETLQLIGREYPDLTLSVATLGLHGAESAKVLAAAGVTAVTLLVDAVDREVAEKIYAWIRPGKKTVPLVQAIPLLIGEQPLAARACKEAGCKVTVRTTVYPGINGDHVAKIARVMAACGAESMQLVPCAGEAGAEDQLISPPDQATMRHLAADAAKYLATTIAPEREPLLGVDCPSPDGGCKAPLKQTIRPSKTRPNVAVASMSGMEVDLHLGQAYQILIYGPREDGLICLLGTRPVPEPGSGSSRWQELGKSLPDCFAILAASAGESPRRILGEQGVTVLITDGEIEGTIDKLYGGTQKGKCKK